MKYINIFLEEKLSNDKYFLNTNKFIDFLENKYKNDFEFIKIPENYPKYDYNQKSLKIFSFKAYISKFKYNEFKNDIDKNKYYIFYNDLENDKYYVHIEPILSHKINIKNKFVYHISTNNYTNNILKNGLILSNKNYMLGDKSTKDKFYRPERIYVIVSNKEIYEELDDFCYIIYNNINIKNGKKYGYSIFEIINKDLDIYYDAEATGTIKWKIESGYCISNISLKDIKQIDSKKLNERIKQKIKNGNYN